jgi:hypothetical protein
MVAAEEREAARLAALPPEQRAREEQAKSQARAAQGCLMVLVIAVVLAVAIYMAAHGH